MGEWVANIRINNRMYHVYIIAYLSIFSGIFSMMFDPDYQIAYE